MYGYNFYNQNQSQDDRIWVQSRQAAEAYLVAPGGFVRLWDSNKNIYYEKRADASGRPLPLEEYEYIKKVETTDYPIDIRELSERLARLEERYAEHNTDDAGI